MAKMKQGDDPSDFHVDEVLTYLEDADSDERARVLQSEVRGKHRKTLLEDSGYEFDPDARYDGSGRKLYPWETDPAKAAGAKLLGAVSDEGPEGPQSPTSGADPTAGEQDATGASSPADDGVAAAGVAETGATTTTA